MSKQKTDKGFPDSGAITEQAMIAYLNNELSETEKQQFEKLLADDPFAADALEGLKNSSDRVAVKTRISTINKKIRHQTGIKDKKIIELHWSNYAWAAVVLGMLIGIGFLMVNYLGKGNKELAVNKPKADVNIINTEPAAETKLEQAPIKEEVQKDADAVQQQTAEDVAPPDDKNISSNAIAAPQTQTPTVNAAPNGAVTMNSTLTASKSAGASNTYGWAVADSVSVNSNSSGTYAVTTKDALATTQADRKEAANSKAKPAEKKGADAEVMVEGLKTTNEPDVTVGDAMKKFNSGNYKAAADMFDVILKKEPDNKEAQYFGAVSDYLNAKYNKSEKTFDKLLKGGTNYVDGSKWYKANILLQKGKKEEAKKLLTELSNSAGSYKERAVKKLTEIY